MCQRRRQQERSLRMSPVILCHRRSKTSRSSIPAGTTFEWDLLREASISTIRYERIDFTIARRIQYKLTTASTMDGFILALKVTANRKDSCSSRIGKSGRIVRNCVKVACCPNAKMHETTMIERGELISFQESLLLHL